MRRSFGAALLLASLAACEGSPILVVQVRTDLAPGVSFDAVRVRLEREGPASLDRVVLAVDGSDWGAGVRVLEEPVAAGRHRLVVSALDASGAVIVERPLAVRLEGGGVRVSTVLLTADCRGVVCPAPAGDPALAACVGGRCASDECTEEDGAACGASECAAAEDCPAVSACATRECTASGTCFAAPIAGACSDGLVCDVAAGCRAPTTYVACAGDAECSAGKICVQEFSVSRCRTACASDADCGSGQRCGAEVGQIRAHCAGDPCDPVTDTGCPLGTTCTALPFLTTPGEPTTRILLPACRPAGSTPERAPCGTTTECASGTCESFGLSSGACARHCRTNADCDELCARYRLDEDDFGLCTPACDPVDDAGCGVGLTCFLERRPIVDTGGTAYSTWCAPPGVRGIGEACDFFDPCAPGGYCLGIGGAPSACIEVCDVAAPSCDCTPIGFTTAGREIGLCYPP